MLEPLVDLVVAGMVGLVVLVELEILHQYLHHKETMALQVILIQVVQKDTAAAVAVELAAPEVVFLVLQVELVEME